MTHWSRYSVSTVHIYFFFNDTATTEIYTLSLHDALPVNYRSGRGLASENSGGIGGNFFGSESGARGYTRINLEVHRGTADGVFDSVQNIHHPFYLADRPRDFWGPSVEQRSVLRKQFDLDRLRLAGEVANHILQDLHELHANGRLLGVDLRANIFHYVVDGALAILPQLYQNVAAIGFGYGCKPELQAGSPRRALDFGNRLCDLLHAEHHAIGFRERGSRRRPIVERKPTFVHLGHQVGTGESIAEIRCCDQKHAQPRQPQWFL